MVKNLQKTLKNPHKLSWKSEVEDILNRIKTHKSVQGIIIINKEASIIRTTYTGDRKEEGEAIAKAIHQLTVKAKATIRDLNKDVFLLEGSKEILLGKRGVFESKIVFFWEKIGKFENFEFFWKDELKFLRVRSQNNEIMVAPGIFIDFLKNLSEKWRKLTDKEFILIVVQGPRTEPKEENEWF